MLADRMFILMPICARYTPCKRDATKQFLVQAEECLCNSLHTFIEQLSHACLDFC